MNFNAFRNAVFEAPKWAKTVPTIDQVGPKVRSSGPDSTPKQAPIRTGGWSENLSISNLQETKVSLSAIKLYLPDKSR